MLKVKTSLLCSALSIALLSGANLAHAIRHNHPYPLDTKDTLKPAPTHVGAYVEAGGNMGLFNMLDEQILNENGFLNIVLDSPNAGLTGGLGIRIYSVSLGIDVSHFLAPLDVTNYYFNGTEIPDGDKESIGNLDMSVISAKITDEYSIDGHNTLYGFAGVGGAMYEIQADDTFATYSSKYISPAIILGVGYKLYTSKNKGLYLSIGAKYTGVLNTDLNTSKNAGDLDLSGWLSTTQFQIKIGYQF